jgi:tetratricopeptide (TPR) repeat protein
MNYFVLRLCLLALIAFPQIDVAIAQNSETEQQLIPEDQLLVLLLEGKYEELDNKLQALQKAYIGDRSIEKSIHRAFYEFYRADPRIGRALDKWIAKRPNSAMPYLARGIYRTRTGWVNRGENWSSNTSDSQFSGMAAWFSVAMIIDPSLMEPYCYLIEIDINEGGRKTRTLFNQALKINPISFIVRESYLHSKLPRWGGSYKDMNEIIAEAQSYCKDDPQLKLLEGRVAADIGELALFRKDYQGAIKYFNDALVNGDYPFYNQNMGEALYGIDDYKGAVDQFSRVITAKPGFKRAWWMRSQAYKMLHKFSQALADINYTINMEPDDDKAIAARGYIFENAGDFASALRDFRKADKLNPKNSEYQEAIKDVQQWMKRTKTN